MRPSLLTRFGRVGVPLAALVPLLLVSGFAVREAMRACEATEQASLCDTAAISAAAVDARLAAYAAAMTTLSLAPNLQRDVTVAPNVSGHGTIFAFHRLEQAPGWIVFAGQTAEARTGWPPGPSKPPSTAASPSRTVRKG